MTKSLPLDLITSNSTGMSLLTYRKHTNHIKLNTLDNYEIVPPNTSAKGLA